MVDDHRLGGVDSCGRKPLADNTSFPSMHLFVDAIVSIEDGGKVWVRGVA